MTSDAARFVGTIPDHYDGALVPVIFTDYAQDIARRVAACRPNRVLETAAGTGIVTRLLRDMLPDTTSLTATDLNAPMLEIARRKIPAEKQVAFLPADAMALQFADNSFDVVACQFGVMFYPDKDKAYAEVHRVLAPGGTYLFNVWDSHRYVPFARITHALVEKMFAVDPPQFMILPFSYSFDPIKESLLAAGFVNITVAVVRIEKEIPDTRMFARGVIRGTPLVDQIAARTTLDPEEIVEELARSFDAAFGTNPARMPLQAMVVSAKKPS